MVDFAKLNREWRATLTPEESARIDAYNEREQRYEAGATDVVAIFERLVWRDVAPPEPVAVQQAPRRPPPFGSPFGVRRSSMALQAERVAVPAAKPRKVEQERHVEKSWEKTIQMRIEDRPNDDGTLREIIRFIGGETGHESYALDEGFVRMLANREERADRPRFYICAGTPGRYDGCSVAHEDVLAYVLRMRPELFADIDMAPSAPGMR